METRERGSWGLSSASVHTHEICIYSVTIVAYYACFQKSQYIDIQSKEERERETNKERARERETHIVETLTYLQMQMDIVCVCVCDAMLVSAGNRLWTRGHGLQTPDYRPQAIDMTQAVDTRGEDHRLQTTDHRSQSMGHGP